MKTSTLIISIVVSLVLGTVAGFSFGKGAGDNKAQNKELQDSIVMMKEQSASIKTMAEIMKSSGVVVQEMGMKYKDDTLVSKGKDLSVTGEKYIGMDTKATNNSGSMGDMMGN